MKNIHKILVICTIYVMIAISSNALPITSSVPDNLTTDSNAMHALKIARLAGMAEMLGKVAATEYNSKSLSYSEYQNYTTQSNEIIRAYNTMLETLFNDTIVRKEKISEFEPCHY